MTDSSKFNATMKFTVGYDEGQGVVEAEMNDPWTSLWRRSALTGQPTGQWKGLGFRLDGVPYSMGFVALGRKSRRLHWFPATILSAQEYELDDRGEFDHFVGRLIDHVTLDPSDTDRFKSHLTYTDGTHGPTVTHHRRPHELLPWLTVFLPDLSEEHLRLVPESLTMAFPSPRIDEGYLPDLAGDGGWTVRDAPTPVDPPRFIQFSIWAGLWPGWEHDAWNLMPVAQPLGLLAPGGDIQSSAVGWRFADDRGLVAMLSWVPGTLDQKRIVRPSRVEGPPLKVPA